VIVDNNKVLDIQASGKDVAVTGNGNTIHIHGDLPRLALIGRDNVVELDRVGTIALLGAQNQVSYLSGLGSDGPTIDRVGTNNSVTVRAAQNASRPPPTAAAQTNVNPKLPVWHKNRPQSPSYGSRKVVAFVLIDLQAF
jgi:hypothetical protein